MTIRELDDDTVRQIAAGEVIERPASVVKELVENSLDADASRIDVGVERGGKERIRVADDGVGMTREEVETAVRKHTTSKITDTGDLDAIGTLGFRGEALYAVGAVSTMTITTKPRGGERATELTVENGEVVSVGPAGRPPGTTVEVTDLFAEMPAREKFLKTDATEFDHVNRIVTRYALANPGVAVSLIHGDRETFATTGQSDLQGTLLSVYGREVAESMIPVDGEGVSGYVSHPETTRSTREYLSTYVNGRYVSSGALRDAVLDAYGKQLAPDRYPFAVVFVEVPPDAVDVNVHPRKLQVKYEDPEDVKERVRSAVTGALLDHGLVRSGAPRGKSAPGEVDATPDPGPADVADAEAGIEDPDSSTSADAGGDTADASGSPPIPDSSFAHGSDTGGSSTADGGGTTAEADANAGGQRAADPTANADRGDRDPRTGRIRSDGTQATLDSGVDGEPAFDRLPSMRVLGQLHDTYVVAETDDGLVLVDQHAADERVNYERLRERVDGATQALAEPVELELTAREAALFPTAAEALSEMGFRAERTGDRTVEVRAVPAVLAEAFEPALLRDVLSEALDGEETSVDARIDALLADLACYPSITGHTPLTEGSIRALLEALDGCENPYACPHGRPAVIEIDEGELEERFERDYPGHAGRRAE